MQLNEISQAIQSTASDLYILRLRMWKGDPVERFAYGRDRTIEKAAPLLELILKRPTKIINVRHQQPEAIKTIIQQAMQPYLNKYFADDRNAERAATQFIERILQTTHTYQPLRVIVADRPAVNEADILVLFSVIHHR